MTKIIVKVFLQFYFDVVMKIPFSIDEFLNVFERYNQALWPLHIFFYALALLAIAAILKGGSNSGKIVMSILSFFWIWMGLVYHILFFSEINAAAYFFGILFLVQGLVLLYFGVIKQTIQLEFNLQLPGIIAILFLTYSLVLYPLIGYGMGHMYPRAPTFGVPCPTTIFTFSLLLYSVQRIRWYILSVPLLWSVIGFFAAMHLSVKEDFGLVIAGVLSVIILRFYKPNA